MFNNSNNTDEGWSPDGIDQSPSAIINAKKRLLRVVGMLRMLKVLRAVGLLALFSALVMEFHRGTPIANEGVGGGGNGSGGNAIIFIRGGSGGGGIAADMLLEASASAVTERNDAADYEDKSQEQTQADVTGDKADDNYAEDSTYNAEEVKTDERQQHASIVVPHSAEESSKLVDVDDCDGCDDDKDLMPNAHTAIDDNVTIPPPEPFKRPVLISVQAAHPSKSTTPVEQIVLLGERHSGTELIADHLAKCFDVKVSVRPRFLFAESPLEIDLGK